MKYLVTFCKKEYKFLEIDAEPFERNLIKYNEPYTSMIEKIQKDGWSIESIIKDKHE